MRKRNTQLFILSTFLVASLLSAVYLTNVSTNSGIADAPAVFQFEETPVESTESYLPDVAVVQALLGTAKRFFAIQE